MNGDLEFGDLVGVALATARHWDPDVPPPAAGTLAEHEQVGLAVILSLMWNASPVEWRDATLEQLAQLPDAQRWLRALGDGLFAGVKVREERARDDWYAA